MSERNRSRGTWTCTEGHDHFREVSQVLKWQRASKESAFSSRLWVTLFIVLLAVCMSNCGGEDPPDWEAVNAINAVASPSSAPPTTDELIVYLDTSGSMAGYVISDGQNVFGRTLRAVRDIATSFNQPVRVSVRYVAATVGSPDPDGALALQKASVTDVYKGGETDLAGAINSFTPRSEPPTTQGSSTGNPAANGTTAETPQAAAPPPARFHILITDGVQSTRSQNSNLACLKGSDATCVREKIINLVKQGWGGYVIGLRSQFHGTIYSEVSPGKKIPYNTPEGALKRYRPFYLYIFSPDRTALDGFVEVLRERLRSVAPQDTMRVLALTSPYAVEAAKAELLVPREAEDTVEPIGGQEENPARFTIEVNRDKDEASPAPFSLTITVPWSSFVRDSGRQEELARLLRWEVEPVYPKEESANGAGPVRYPVVKLKNATGEPVIKDGHLEVQASVGWPRSTAKPAWRVFRLQSRLDVAMGHEPLPWIKQWSTDLDTTDTVGDRTLNLESVLTGLWRNPVLEQQTVTTVYLRVGPK